MTNAPDVVSCVKAIAEPIDRLRAATAELAVAQGQVNELARLRRQTIQDLHDAGMSYAQIGDAAGITRGRIHQIKHGGPPPEGTFLGSGRITIVTPLKREAIPSRPVVAMEDVTGAQRLAECAHSMSLETTFEHIPIGGAIDLNRPGLIVICGPRISEPVAQVLAQDPILQFERAPDGPWTLVDTTTGAAYRSGADQDPPAPTDVAYLGRLNRPDGRGSVMVFTGIHPAGSLGVVEVLCTRLAELYAEVKTENFSTLVETNHDPVTNEPMSVRLLTPLYTMGGNK